MTVDIIIPTYKPDETLCLLLNKLRGIDLVVFQSTYVEYEKRRTGNGQ